MANKSSALLIGTNISDERIRKCAAVSRRTKDTKINHLDGVLKDLSQMKTFMNSRQIPVFDVMLGQHQVKQRKEDILNTIERFFDQSVKRFVIYYTGHGSNGTFETKLGDWCFEKNSEKDDASDESSGLVYIGLNDVLELWDEMRRKLGSDSFGYEERDILYIIADSCYSGAWVDTIKAERELKSDPNGTEYRDVHMIASCHEKHCCYTVKGGDFTDHYINADSSMHNLQDTSAHLAKLTAQSVVQTLTFPIYMPVKGICNYVNVISHLHYPQSTNESKEKYKILLMRYGGYKLPIGRGLAIATGWSWMLSGQIFHN